jgi:hypothetical protein
VRRGHVRANPVIGLGRVLRRKGGKIQALTLPTLAATRIGAGPPRLPTS